MPTDIEIVTQPIEAYLEALAGPPADEPVRVAMERLAAERGFPIVGPHVGRLLSILARTLGARRVLELGSGFGYSAYWFARAVGEGGEVHCTELSADNRDQALSFLGQAGLGQRVTYHLGDALELARSQPDGTFDLVFNDVDKELYPQTVELAVKLLRPGGLFITDNALWKGRVTAPAEADETTRAVLEFNRLVTDHPALETVIVPLRDGLAICRKRVV
jgi:caffeoyl-CoA O-methyltransferase